MFSHEQKDADNEGDTERDPEADADGDDLQFGVKG